MTAAAWSVAHAAAVEDHPSHTVLRSSCGRVLTLSSARWWAEPAPEEQRVLDLVLSPVIDIGCGPGRLSIALSRRGMRSMGVDASTMAVAAARARGAWVTHRSVFDQLPDEGGWGSALLLDGNVGIGGDPRRLFRRTRELLRPGGRALLEVEAPGELTETLAVCAELPAGSTEWFRWARVGVDGLPALARATGFMLVGTWADSGRWFARMDAQ